MSQTRSLVLLAGAALSLGANAALAQQASTDEVRAVVAEMMRDAETRTSLLSSGDGGHDNGGFFLAGDGFRLNVGGMVQFRYLVNFRDEDETSDQNEFESGFQTRRTKLNFAGNINKDWSFRVEGNWDSNEENSFTLEDAWAAYTFANGVKAQWGQFKLPLLREELVADSKQLAVERSITNDTFSQGWSQGIQFSYAAEAWRLAGAFSDGLKSQNTDFNARESINGGGGPQTFTIGGEAEYAFTGRFEYMFGGNWGMFDDFTAAKGQDFGGLIGVAAHYQQSDNTAQFTDNDRNTFEGTVDVSFEGDSWNIYGAFIGRWTDVNPAGPAEAEDALDFGFVVHGGYRFAENTELFARWDGVILDDDRNLEEDSFNFLTFGVNQYYAGHAAKATVDLMYALEATSDFADATGVGQASTGQGILGQTDDGEFVIRLQFQLLF
jgi:hypothetical protein